MNDSPSFLNRLLPAATQVVVGIGGVFWMAHLVDQGSTHAWPMWQQGLWFFGMMVLMSIGVRPILRIGGGDERFAWMPIVITVWLGLVIVVAWRLNVTLGLSVWSTVFGAHAGVVAFGTWRRPWWFWEDWRAHWLRGIIGDTLARWVYAGVAVVLAIGAIIVAKR